MFKAFFEAILISTLTPTHFHKILFSNFFCMFLNPNLNFKYSNLLVMRNLREQVKKAFSYQKLFWPFTVQTNCFKYLKTFAKTFSLEFQKFFSITRTFLTEGWKHDTIILFSWYFFLFFLEKRSMDYAFELMDIKPKQWNSQIGDQTLINKGRVRLGHSIS